MRHQRGRSTTFVVRRMAVVGAVVAASLGVAGSASAADTPLWIEATCVDGHVLYRGQNGEDPALPGPRRILLSINGAAPELTTQRVAGQFVHSFYDRVGPINGDIRVERWDGANWLWMYTTTKSTNCGPSSPWLQGGVPGDHSVALSWSPPSQTGGSAIDDYRVDYRYLIGSSFSDWVTYNPTVSTEPYATIPGLRTDTFGYQFRIVARNTTGTWGWYSNRSQLLSPYGLATPNGPPTGVPGNTQVALNWPHFNNNGAVVTDYVVQVKRTISSTWLTVADGVGTSPFATATGLINGAGYQFRIAAVNAAGTSTFSAASAMLVPRTIPAAPAAPAGTPGDRRVTLTWAAPSNGGSTISDYIVQYKSTGSSTWLTFADGVRSSTGATVTGLTNGSYYHFRVAARNAAGQGPYGAVSASLLPRTVPSAPAAPTGVAGAQRITLSWAAPSNGGLPITDYIVQYRRTTVATWSTFNDGVRSTTGATVTGLTTGAGYVFRVAARNSYGTGAYGPMSGFLIPR